MSILNVNQIQPVGGGNTITVNASDVSASGVTITASSFVGPVTGNVTGNVTSSSTSTFSSGINVTSGRVLIGTTNAGSNGTADDLVVANNGSASDQAGITIRGGTSGRSQIFFSDGTSGQDEYRGMLRYDHSENSMQFRTAATERLRITSAGLVGVNCTPLSQFQVKTATNANIALTADGSEASIEAFNDAGSANVPLRIRGSQIKFKIDGTQRARLSYSSSSAVFSLGDESNSAGHLRFEAKASENQIHGRSNHPITFLINTAEKLRILSDGTVATGALSATPGTVAAGSYIQAAANAGFFNNGYDGKFGTSSNHPVYFQVNGTSKASITSAGNVNIIDGNLVVASGHGIDFSAGGNAGGMTSELLDDYEEGTWTPTLGGNASYDIRVGTYTKIGNVVYAYCRIRPTSLGTGSSNTISGLPFTCNNDNGGVMIGYYDGSAVSSVEIGGVVNSNGSIGLFTKTSATNNTGTGAFFQDNCRIYLSTVYQTSS